MKSNFTKNFVKLISGKKWRKSWSIWESKPIFRFRFRLSTRLYRSLNFSLSTSKRWDKKILRTYVCFWTGSLFSCQILTSIVFVLWKNWFFFLIGKVFPMTIHSWIGKCQERVINLIGLVNYIHFLNVFSHRDII